MGKVVFSYHNKKHSVTTFRGLYQNIYNHKRYFYVDVDGNPAIIEYYNRLLQYIDRPGAEFAKIRNFSLAKTLLDSHNAKMQGLMQTCNKQMKLMQVMPDGETVFMPMSEILSQAFIMYQGQTF